jgi:tetratricopeptide (TPR) repeat protein
LALSGRAQTNAYIVSDADEYFRSGRYFDAFFAYRTASRLPEFAGDYQIEQQVKNSSRALYLKKKYQDFRSFKKYDLAREHLVLLVEINPMDPFRDQIPKITLEQAESFHRMAWRQRSPRETADMLQRAIGYYHQAIREGLVSESVQVAIKMAEKSMRDTGVSDIPNTTLGVSTQYNNAPKPPPSTRKVEIKENDPF